MSFLLDCALACKFDVLVAFQFECCVFRWSCTLSVDEFRTFDSSGPIFFALYL